MDNTKTVNEQHSQIKGRISGLDGLRAIAVLAVIAYHLELDWMPGGLLGVGIFFVLSGYLITDILVMQREKLGRIDLRDFWLRRARRLLPGLFFFLIIVVIWMAISDPSRLTNLWKDLLASLIYLNNWWFIISDASYFSNFGEPSPLLHLWSLAVEEQFYLFWPFLLWLGLFFIRKRKRKWLIGLILLGALVSALAMAYLYEPGLMDQSRIYYGTDTRAFALLIGAALALYLPSQKVMERSADNKRTRVILSILGVGGLATLLWMVLYTNEVEPFLYQGGMVLQCVATVAVIVAIVHPSLHWFNRMLGWGPLKWLGVRSYGIYLWHYPILTLSLPEAISGDEYTIIRIVAQLALIITIAGLSWKFIESPIRYKNRNKQKSTALVIEQ
ncbi:acyltransferase family protein [Marininema mesophilum]|nr:acyltransferase [Marininema mesophilum]